MLIKENFQCTQEEFDNTKSSHNINIQCLHCQEIFQRPKKLIVSDLKNRGHYPTCCSVKCLMPYKKQFTYTLVNCKHCNIEFKKRNTEIIKSPKHFCTISCAAKFNSAVSPLRLEQKLLKEAKRLAKEQEIKLPKIIAIDNTTKGDLFNDRPNWQAARSGIQKRARNIFIASDKLKQCLECGYNKHYEVCHIKSVASFSNETLISEINNIDNLIALCPTHHWEFDHGHLILQ